MQQAPHPSRGAGPATLYLIYKGEVEDSPYLRSPSSPWYFREYARRGW